LQALCKWAILPLLQCQQNLCSWFDNCCCPCLFSVCPQKQQSGSSGFSLGFGSIGRIGMRNSSGGGSSSKAAKAAAAPSKPVVVPSSLLKAGAMDDDMPEFTSTALATR
jgi:hypothetical protein